MNFENLRKLLEILKKPVEYQDASKKAVEKILRSLGENGISIKIDYQNPLTNTYSNILQSGADIDNEARALSRILLEFAVIGEIAGNYIAEGWKMTFDEIFGLYDEAGAYTYPVDPLILDLDGDGIETVLVEDGVNFDFDNNGFEALKYFDTNGDNSINQLDEIYSELRVWQDTNQNGQMDEGELLTLEGVGIAGLNLSYENIDVRDENGSSYTQTSTYIKAVAVFGFWQMSDLIRIY